MGFSAPIASGVVLIAFTIAVATLFQALVVEVQTLYQLINEKIAQEIDGLGVAFQLSNISIDVAGGKLNFTIKNTGSKEIFLKNQGSLRNDVIIAYNTADGAWRSQVVEYEVLEVRITGTEKVFDPASHLYLAPGEEVVIGVEVGYLEPGSVLIIVFASHYGVTASVRWVVPQ